MLTTDHAHKALCAAQQQLARSTKVLAKNHRTKFITGHHNLVYRSTDGSPEVKQEMALAADRIRKEKGVQERASITKLSAAVDRLAVKYDRYNLISHTNIHNTRCDADGLPCTVNPGFEMPGQSLEDDASPMRHPQMPKHC